MLQQEDVTLDAKEMIEEWVSGCWKLGTCRAVSLLGGAHYEFKRCLPLLFCTTPKRKEVYLEKVKVDILACCERFIDTQQHRLTDNGQDSRRILRLTKVHIRFSFDSVLRHVYVSAFSIPIIFQKLSQSFVTRKAIKQSQIISNHKKHHSNNSK